MKNTGNKRFTEHDNKHPAASKTIVTVAVQKKLAEHDDFSPMIDLTVSRGPSEEEFSNDHDETDLSIFLHSAQEYKMS